MARDNQEQPDVPPFEYRAGVTIPAIGGMYRRGDPSQIPPHRLHLGVNIRLADGETGSRPGLTRVVDDEAEGGACVTGIFEIEDSAVGLYITKFATAVPFAIMAFNEEKTPPEADFWDEDATLEKASPSPWRDDLNLTAIGAGVADAFNTFQRVDERMVIANGASVYEAEFSEDDGLPRLDISHLFTLPATATGNIASTCVRRERVDDPRTGDEFDKDVLYMGTEDQVWRYDGTTVELVHTLTNGGPMQVISYHGAGLVAAGSAAAGFSYQEQPGFAWADQAWGLAFVCNGLCEFAGQVCFVGRVDSGGGFLDDGTALRWTGAGAPIVFQQQVAAAFYSEYRSPIVVGGALHWLHYSGESGGGTTYAIARFTDYATGASIWAGIGVVTGDMDRSQFGFFIPYAGRMLLYSKLEGPGAAWPAGDNLMFIESGVSATFEFVYAFPEAVGSGYEALPL